MASLPDSRRDWHSLAISLPSKKMAETARPGALNVAMASSRPGNHDIDGWTYGTRTKEDRDDRFSKSIKKDVNAAWRLCFHEDFQGIYTKVVKGYTFIGGHWSWDRGIEQYMEENKSKIDPNLPFFYLRPPSMLTTFPLR